MVFPSYHTVVVIAKTGGLFEYSHSSIYTFNHSSIHSSIQAIRQLLAYYQFLDHIGILTGDTDKVGTLCKAFDIEALSTIAIAFKHL